MTTNNFGCDAQIKQINAYIYMYEWGLRELSTLPLNELIQLFNDVGINLGAGRIVDISLSIPHLCQRLIEKGIAYRNLHSVGLNDYTPRVLGYTLPFSWLAVMYKITYEGSKVILDQMLFNIIVAFFALVPATMLELAFSSGAYAGALNFLSTLLIGRRLGLLSSIAYPWTSRILSTLTFGLSSCAFGARAAVIPDYFSGVWCILLTIFVIITTISYKSYSPIQLLDKLLCKLAQMTASNETAAVISIMSQLNDVPYVLSNVPAVMALEFVEANGGQLLQQSAGRGAGAYHAAINSNLILFSPGEERQQGESKIEPKSGAESKPAAHSPQSVL